MQKQKPKLLVVDDEIEQCEAIKSYFSKRNFSVFIVSSGEEALTAINKNKPDLVLLDMKLSDNMDGRDVLFALREYDKNTKVAIITGDLLTEEKIKELTELGIAEFILKPVNLETIERVIKKILNKTYPRAIRFEKIKKPRSEASEISLKQLNHELANITSDISSKCEEYILNTEEGYYRNKTEKERLNEAVKIIKSALNSTERLTELIKKISLLIKKETCD